MLFRSLLLFGVSALAQEPAALADYRAGRHQAAYDAFARELATAGATASPELRIDVALAALRVQRAGEWGHGSMATECRASSAMRRGGARSTRRLAPPALGLHGRRPPRAPQTPATRHGARGPFLSPSNGRPRVRARPSLDTPTPRAVRCLMSCAGRSFKPCR